MRIAATVLLLALNVSCASASATVAGADAAKADIDRFAAEVLRQLPDVPGIGLAVVRDGQPYYTRGYGYANVEQKKLAGAATPYYIGSTTKAYTGLASAILAGRGVLDLDAPISKYLPEVTGAAANVSLRRYLAHTSELDNDAIVFRTAFSGEHTPAILADLLSRSKAGKPNFNYDNLGYVVASMVIERVTGKPWQNVFDELLFTPLGMKHTTAYMSEAQRWQMASPYQIDRSGKTSLLTFGKNDAMMHAAGGIVTTPEDLGRWLAANITRKGVPAAAFAEAQRQQVVTKVERGPFKADGYGLGWYQGEIGGERVLFHGGGFEGWRSWFSFMPEKKIGVGVMINASVPHHVGIMLSNYVYDRLLERPDIDKLYADPLSKLAADAEQGKGRMVADVEKRLQRPWMLKNANETYVGRYENPLYGTLTIEQRGDKLHASIGRLSTVLEAFTEPETARVELVPGSGEVLRFADGSIHWRGEVFTRKP